MVPLGTRTFLLAAVLGAVAGCGPDYSPNTYSSNTVQQANKVDQAVVVGVRTVDISAQSGLGTATGAAAGGLGASQLGTGLGNALSTLGGTVVGGIAGTVAEHGVSDTTGYEYIVRKPNGELLSVTQKDETPLAIGQHVLVIAGPQARIVADYATPLEGTQPRTQGPAPPAKANVPPPAAASPGAAQTAAPTTPPAPPGPAAAPAPAAETVPGPAQASPTPPVSPTAAAAPASSAPAAPNPPMGASALGSPATPSP